MTHLTAHGRPTIGQPGSAATELRHRPAAGRAPGRPDVALIELDHDAWHLLGASSRGVQHSLRGEPRQDAAGVILVEDTLYTVVCDGVGEFARSHEAADLVVDTVLGAIADDGSDPLTAIHEANRLLRDRADDGGGELATTVLVAATKPTGSDWLTVELWWVGDPYAWTLVDGTWTWLNAQPATDGPFFSTASGALPAEEPAVEQVAVSVRADGVFFMTDGVGQPLASIEDVKETLARWWTTKPSVFEFAGQTAFARRSHMDDRTVVGLWPERAAAEPAAESEGDA